MRGVALLAAAMTAVLLLPASASAQTVHAHSAADFRDSIGVQTHLSYYDTAYGDVPRIVRKLDELGVDHVRDGMYANPEWGEWNERYYRAVELAAAHGKRFLFGMGEPHWRAGTIDELVGVVAGRLRHAVAGLEGPNEYDLFHAGPNWAPELRDYQREVYRKVRTEPRLNGVPVVGPSLVFDDARRELGSLEDAADLGNIHPYTGGLAPSADLIGGRFDAVAHVFGERPLVASEAGFHNALAARAGQAPVPEDVAASYLLRTYLEHYRAGIRRTYVYELIDEKPEPALEEPEQHFGLLRNDFSEKPAFAALRAMLRLVGRPEAVSPRPLDLRLAGDTAGVQRLLLQKGDGRYMLALWQAASEWDRERRERVPVPVREVTLAFPGDVGVGVARPARGEAAESLGTRRTASIAVSADPVLVDLDFHGPAPVPEPPPAPTPPVIEPELAPVSEPDLAPAPAPAPTLGCRLATGGVVVRRADAAARVSIRRSRARPVKVQFCAARDGKIVVELGPPRRGGRVVRVLARRARRVAGGRPVVAIPKLTRRDQATPRRAPLAFRVRFRPVGARRDVVLTHRLDARGKLRVSAGAQR